MILGWLMDLLSGMVEWGCGVVEGAWSSTGLDGVAADFGSFAARLDGWLPVPDILMMLSILGALAAGALLIKGVTLLIERFVV